MVNGVLKSSGEKSDQFTPVILPIYPRPQPVIVRNITMENEKNQRLLIVKNEELFLIRTTGK